MSEDARSARPQLAAIAWRCMNSSTTLGGDKLAQARAQLCVRHRVLGCKLSHLLQELLVPLRPIDRGRDTVGALPPQVGHAALEHENELVGGRQQAVAQEAADLDRARGFLDARIDRGRPGGHTPGIAAHQHVVELAQVSIDAQLREERDPLEHLADLACGMLGRRTPQPALARLAVPARRIQCRCPALEHGGGHRRANGIDKQSLAVGALHDLVAQDTNQGAALVLRHPAEAQELAGLLLVIEQGSPASVQRAQRGQIRDCDAELAAKVAQQRRGHGTHAVQRPATHANEANVQRKAQPVAVPASARDQFMICAAEAEESLQLEVAELARDVSQAQEGRMPALHGRCSSSARAQPRYAAPK
jgi:hypothetical protein